MLSFPTVAAAQSWDYVNPIPAGTTVQVRTTEKIDTQSMDGRIYTGTVENEVRDAQGRLAIPARCNGRARRSSRTGRRTGARPRLSDGERPTVRRGRYSKSGRHRGVGDAVRNSGIGANKDTAIHVGGGALLGAILGAAIGGGDAAAAGAVVGAAGGAAAQILTKGRRVSVPAETLLTYRLQSDLNLDARDSGYDRDGHHYHKYDPNN